MKHYIKSLSVILIPLLLASCTREITTSNPVESSIINSKIRITSNPFGAQIYLNNKNMGIKTPDSLVWLQPGTHNVTLKLGLFPDHTQSFEIKDTSKINFYYDYTTDPTNLGSILCSTDPQNAFIFLNDSLVNQKSPTTIKGLLPGSYKVKVTFPNHRADSTSTDVRGSKTNNVFFALEDTSVWVSYQVKNSPVTSDLITCMNVDQNNVKWFGTQNGGVINFDSKNWSSTNFGNYVNRIIVDRDNNIWVAANGSCEFFNGKWTDYTGFFSTPNVSSALVDLEGTVWIGTEYGLYYYKNNSWGSYVAPDLIVKLVSPNITALTMDKFGKIWIGTSYGISTFAHGTWPATELNSQDFIKKIGRCITDIKIDSDGIIWVVHKEDLQKGYSGGLTKYDGQNWSVIEIPGVPTNHINRINVDKLNNKWISTVNGLVRFTDPNNPTIFNLSNSKIPGNVVMESAVDKNGDLWIATFGGGIGKLKKNNIPK